MNITKTLSKIAATLVLAFSAVTGVALASQASHSHSVGGGDTILAGRNSP